MWCAFLQAMVKNGSYPNQTTVVMVMALALISAVPGSRAVTMSPDLSIASHVPVLRFEIGKPGIGKQPNRTPQLERSSRILSPRVRFQIMTWPWVRQHTAAGYQSRRQINRDLQAVLAGMRNSAARLHAADVGATTQAVQKQIIARLDQLIKMAAQWQKSHGGAPKNKESERQSMALRPAQGVHTSPMTPSQSARNSFIPGGGMMNPNRMQQFISDHRGWGNLPPRQRQMILNALRHQTLPRYKALVQQYYEALAKLNAVQ
ncbi:MAG: hypothetical protein ACP5I8_13755 [Phycisphaerae bacterium]